MQSSKYNHKKFSNDAVASMLRNIAMVYIIEKKNIFRIRAYQRAAEAVENLNQQIYEIWKNNNIKNINGLGPSIAQHLNEYFQKGVSRHFYKILNKLPKTFFMLTNVSGIGPKKAYMLVKTLKIENPKTVFRDIIKAGKSNKIADIENFGKKSQLEIVNSVKQYLATLEKQIRLLLIEAKLLAQDISNFISTDKTVIRTDALGSLRRKSATVGDIDIAVCANLKNFKKIINHVLTYPNIQQIINKGIRKTSFIVRPNIRIDIRVHEPPTYGSLMQYFTGSKTHNIQLRERCQKMGLSLSEYGITDIKTNKKQIFKTEKKLYSFMGLSYIPPELREGAGEIEAASRGKIPNLVETKDIKGDMHIHTNAQIQTSHDTGKNTYEEIIKQAIKSNYQYIGFADHNPKLSLKEHEITTLLKKRKKDIERASKNYSSIKCFVGLEVDIMPDGRLSLPESAFSLLDYIIVSIHSSFNKNIDDMTKRVLRALSYPKVRILGHPTGRLIQKRQGFELEWEKIFNACKKRSIALEINSSPSRLDLPDTLVRRAKKGNIPLIINTDAHDLAHMKYMSLGISVARRGWCTKQGIYNTKAVDEFSNWVNK